uniref:Uncharacterized protein n=1 Tax=Arundo donax TaxID=35708 RepID=A0A0A9HDK3_ARUDO
MTWIHSTQDPYHISLLYILQQEYMMVQN